MSNFEDLDRLLQKYVDDGLPGCALQIARRGVTIYEKYFGWADKEAGIPLNRTHLFRQASLTKIAMYTVGMMLYEQGRFLMSDPLYEYFPEYRNAKKAIPRADGGYDIVPVDHPILVKHIFNMTAGLPYNMLLGADAPTQHPTSTAMARAMKRLRDRGHYTLREEIREMSSIPLAFEPGSHFLYGFSSELTAGLLEVICGKPAEVVIKEMLFEPLEMTSSANYLVGDMGDRLVKNYYLREGKKLSDPDALYVPENEIAVKSTGPLGSVSGFSRVITNCNDYTHLFSMLANGGRYKSEQIIGRSTIDLIRTNTLSPDMIANDFSNDYLAGYGYGYGMRTMTDPYAGAHNGPRGSFGWTGGSGTWGEADPSRGISIVYMHNLQPNLEMYHHIRMRAVAYGCLD